MKEHGPRCCFFLESAPLTRPAVRAWSIDSDRINGRGNFEGCDNDEALHYTTIR